MTVPPDLEAFIRRETERLAAQPPKLPFAREEYAARLARLRARMLEDGVDVLVLTAPDSMCWLHGYQSRWYRAHSSTTLPPTQCTVVAADDPMFLIETCFHEELVRLTSCITDFRGLPETGLDHEAGVQDYVRFLVEQLRREGWTGGVVGLEAWSCVPNPAVFKVTGGRADRGRLPRRGRDRHHPLGAPAQVAGRDRRDREGAGRGRRRTPRAAGRRPPGHDRARSLEPLHDRPDRRRRRADGHPRDGRRRAAGAHAAHREQPAPHPVRATTSTPTSAAPWTATTPAPAAPTSWATRPPS